MELIPCPRCSRHVRCGSESCPFCGTAMQAPQIETVEVPRGASRAALLAIGAALALGACRSSSTPGGNEPTIAQPYGAPPMPTPSSSTPDAPPSTSAKPPAK